ncbi:ervatamin-B-like [Haliotis rubra]|uniref:ervatamin-B-like n=1 Tax=Haliotis rubra TaxID=36100 RepID=UPI001EE5A0B9|nr:ervatamin-B-like [Haliotis rubra]
MACLSQTLIILALTSSSLGAPRDNLQQRWEEWKVKYGRRYSDLGEEEERRGAWQANMGLVEAHNKRRQAGFSLEMNQFADQILQQRHPVFPALQPRTAARADDTEAFQAPPPSFDWRSKGVISAVKNQGTIGSADAVAAAECMESWNAIKTGQMLNTSYQEIADCCRAHNDTVFDCVHNIGGVCSEKDYPALTGQCRNNTCHPGLQIQGGKRLPPRRPDLMITALLQRPLMVYVDASHVTFQLYGGGVYSDPNCSTERVDHALQLVGYGQKEGQKYWICKNSWSSRWGMDGYIWIRRGSDECAIESYVSYPY